MAKKRNEQYSDDDQDYGEEPNFDDPEGFVDDATDEGTAKKIVKSEMLMPAWLISVTHNLSSDFWIHLMDLLG